jgi:hypothetical protein
MAGVGLPAERIPAQTGIGRNPSIGHDGKQLRRHLMIID